MIGNLYFLAGSVNILGMLAINRFYSAAPAMAAMSPTVFSTESQVLIQVWGLAYISVAKSWRKIPMLSLVFFVEKMLYTWWWLQWIKDDSNRSTAVNMVKSGVLSEMITGGFYLFYGLNDLLFGLVFLYGASVGLRSSAKDKAKSK
jgi:hypothetical protein